MEFGTGSGSEHLCWVSGSSAARGGAGLPPHAHQPHPGMVGTGLRCRRSAAGLKLFVLGASGGEGGCGGHRAGEATHCCLSPGFWKGEVLGGSARRGHVHPAASLEEDKLLFIIADRAVSLPAASIPTRSENRKQYDRMLCLYFVKSASLVIAFYILMNSPPQKATYK